ncbi:hypothetical protein BKA70DRAFT_1229092 [Coprinopsis sp. MPI-PUGE-AT-0042]|nr:hypothetical protein BKA70DRAFT_1229092 [Coprinopsis sp. MPI-PUGE-AT-0042]
MTSRVGLEPLDAFAGLTDALEPGTNPKVHWAKGGPTPCPCQHLGTPWVVPPSQSDLGLEGLILLSNVLLDVLVNVPCGRGLRYNLVLLSFLEQLARSQFQPLDLFRQLQQHAQSHLRLFSLEALELLSPSIPPASSTAPDASGAMPPSLVSSTTNSAGSQGIAGERIIAEDDEDVEDLGLDDEADGSGEGGGDESDDEGDEEDPAEVSVGSDRDEDKAASNGPKTKNYRAPLPRTAKTEIAGVGLGYTLITKPFGFHVNQAGSSCRMPSLPLNAYSTLASSSGTLWLSSRFLAPTANTSSIATVTSSAQGAVSRSLLRSGL